MSSAVSSIRTIIKLMGVLSLLYAGYLIIPWELIAFIGSDGGATEFAESVEVWAVGLVNNILNLVVALMIAALTLGPEAVRTFLGGDQQPPPRF